VRFTVRQRLITALEQSNETLHIRGQLLSQSYCNHPSGRQPNAGHQEENQLERRGIISVGTRVEISRPEKLLELTDADLSGNCILINFLRFSRSLNCIFCKQVL
jgi:hypothetical protein